MDAQMTSESGTFPSWDFALTLGTGGADYVAIISGEQEAQQEAQVAAYLILGSVPQLPGAGVDHLGFLGGSTNFGMLDAGVRSFLINVGRSDYYPDYDIQNGTLIVIPKKVQT
jgi:hypothetical protein